MSFGQRVFVMLALLGLLAGPACADEVVSLKAGYLNLNLSGDVAVTEGLTGTRLDVEDDLGFDDTDGYFVEAALQLGSFRLFAAYLPIRFSGDNTLTEDIDFNGETFVGGSRVESEMDIDIYEAGLAWFLINLDDTPVRVQIGPEVAVKYVDAQIELQENIFDLDESASIGVPVPTLGLRARLSAGDFLSVLGRAGYLEYDSNSFMDIDAQIEFSPLPMVGLFAGYRYLDIDVEEDDVFIDAEFAGPYAGALIRF